MRRDFIASADGGNSAALSVPEVSLSTTLRVFDLIVDFFAPIDFLVDFFFPVGSSAVSGGSTFSVACPMAGRVVVFGDVWVVGFFVDFFFSVVSFFSPAISPGSTLGGAFGVAFGVARLVVFFDLRVFGFTGDLIVSVDSVDTSFFSLVGFVDIAFFFWETGFTTVLDVSSGTESVKPGGLEIVVGSFFGDFLIFDLTGDLSSVVDAKELSFFVSVCLSVLGFAIFFVTLLTAVFFVSGGFMGGVSVGLGDSDSEPTASFFAASVSAPVALFLVSFPMIPVAFFSFFVGFTAVSLAGSTRFVSSVLVVAFTIIL
jgi:hypothetical protein